MSGLHVYCGGQQHQSSKVQHAAFDTSTTEGGANHLDLLRCICLCLPLLHHPVLLLHQARPRISMDTKITI